MGNNFNEMYSKIIAENEFLRNFINLIHEELTQMLENKK